MLKFISLNIQKSLEDTRQSYSTSEVGSFASPLGLDFCLLM